MKGLDIICGGAVFLLALTSTQAAICTNCDPPPPDIPNDPPSQPSQPRKEPRSPSRPRRLHHTNRRLSQVPAIRPGSAAADAHTPGMEPDLSATANAPTVSS
jgi:hypothetical protein